MRRNNGLSPGKWDFSFPKTPEPRSHGCHLHRGTFDPSIGSEVFAFYREDPEFAENLSDVEPFTLIAHMGIARTPFGAIAVIVWQIAAGEPQEVMSEQYINTANEGALALVSDASEQSHFKFVAINRITGDVTVVIDFLNTFAFDTLYTQMISAQLDAPCVDFQAAGEYMKNTYTVDELVMVSKLGHNS